MNNQPIPPLQNPPVSVHPVTAPQLPTTTGEVTNQNILTNLKNKLNSSSKGTKILIIVITALFFLIFLLAILVALVGKKKVAVVLTPSPSPISVSPAPQIIFNASRYATDEAVLKIESNLTEIQKQLESGDVRESALSIPSPEFNINFTK